MNREKKILQIFVLSKHIFSINVLHLWNKFTNIVINKTNCIGLNYYIWNAFYLGTTILNGWFQKISIPIPHAASQNSKGDGGFHRLEFQVLGEFIRLDTKSMEVLGLGFSEWEYSFTNQAQTVIVHLIMEKKVKHSTRGPNINRVHGRLIILRKLCFLLPT